MLLSSVSAQQRFGVMDIKALSVSQLSDLGQTTLQLSGLEQTMLQLLDISVLQLRVTALFYLENSRRIHPPSVRACRPKDVNQSSGERERQRERERALWLLLWLLFLYVFSLPLGLPYVNWASQDCCFFYLWSSLRSSELPLFYFCGLFPSLTFSHLHPVLLFPILTT